MNNEHKFDSIFKSRLEEINVNQPLNAWDKFSRASKMSDARSGHFFDQAISRSLTTIQPLTNGNEWSSFRNHLENVKISDEIAFDKNIKASVQKHSPASGIQADRILESAIENSIIRNKKLLPSKILEACLIAIILLLLFTYTPLLQNEPKTKELVPTDLQKGADMDRADISDQPKVGQSESIISEPTMPATSQIQNSSNDVSYAYGTKLMKGSFAKELKITGGGKKVNKDAVPRSLNAELTGSELKNSTVIYDQQELKNSAVNTDLKDNGELAKTNPEAAIINLHAPVSTTMNDELLSLNALHINPRSLYSNEINPVHPDLPVFKFRNKKLLSSLWLGFRIGQAFDMIKSPGGYHDGQRLTHFQRAKSTIADFNIEFKNDFVNVESGIKYSYKKFNVSDDSYEDAHFINIPLTIKKDFLPQNRLMPFFKIGPDITFVAAASYEPTPENTKNNKQYQGAPALNATGNLNDGIINQGSISTNSFLGIHGAIGFEYKLNNFSKFSVDLTQQINPFDKRIGISSYSFSETSITIGYKRLLFENLY